MQPDRNLLLLASKFLTLLNTFDIFAGLSPVDMQTLAVGHLLYLILYVLSQNTQHWTNPKSNLLSIMDLRTHFFKHIAILASVHVLPYCIETDVCLWTDAWILHAMYEIAGDTWSVLKRCKNPLTGSANVATKCFNVEDVKGSDYIQEISLACVTCTIVSKYAGINTHVPAIRNTGLDFVV